MSISFVVEQAGCESCAQLVRGALEPLGTVEAVEVDERADEATVRLGGETTEEEVNLALAGASQGVGHAYRVRTGSWRG